MVDGINKAEACPLPEWPGGESMSNEKSAILERLLRNPRIPSPPTLALQVLEMTSAGNCTVDEISELLTHDPGLCAKILKALNSSVYGRSRAVTSVHQAVAALGNRPLRSLVLGLTLPVIQGSVQPDAALRRFWKKSVAGAVMARDIAARCKWPAPDDAMVTGLLRNLGMILLNQNFKDNYLEIWSENCTISVDDQCAWEELRFGVNHAEVGAALLEQWRLPMELVEPIRFHHQPKDLRTLTANVADRAFLLEFVSQLTGLNEHAIRQEKMTEVLRTARERYDLGQEELVALLAAIRPRIEAFSAILGVDIGPFPDFDDLLAKGCEELVRVSLECDIANNSERSGVVMEATTDFNCADSVQIHEMLSDLGNLSSCSKILHYEVVEAIGRGAMGIVVKAYDPGLARFVAIKVLAPEMHSSDRAHQRFALEARFAASLRHENVVSIHAVSMLNGVPFLVMEFVPGASLDDLLKQGRTFSVDEIARIGRETALGLAAAHEAHLIHRDVKPANILIEETTGHVRVADFGLARALDEDMHISLPGLLVGTPLYMSPEQVDGQTLTAASDLFSLGSVLYTLCTGELPFQAATMSGLLCAVAEKEPIAIGECNAEIPEWLIEVIQCLHAKDPASRPGSAALVAKMLQPR